MIRAVLDSNVVISALLFGGRASPLVPAWKHGRFTWLISQVLVQEYVRVLHYPKFKLTRDEIRALIEEEILPYGTPVTVTRVRRVIAADPSDNDVLACALVGRADRIVSGDHHLRDLKVYRGIPIVSPVEFLEWLPHA